MPEPREIVPGSLVRLVCCPHGQPGIVRSFAHGRFVVEWLDLGLTAKHSPASLLVVGDAPGAVNLKGKVAI